MKEKDKNLIEKLKEYDDLYYNEGTSPITDEEYDLLKESVKKQFPDDPYFQEVGAEPSSKKVKLPYVLGSLNKVRPDNVLQWVQNEDSPIVVTPKIDGVSFIVKYENGKVVFAATRGDGQYGKDITEKAKIFCSEMGNGSYGTFILRGEVVLTEEHHKYLGFKTKRNGAAGILNRDEADPDVDGFLLPVFYELIYSDDFEEETEFHRLSILADFGFNVVPVIKFQANRLNIEKLIDFLKESKEVLPYEIDGLVLARDNSERENTLVPKNKVAFKINDEPVDVIVEDIEWNTTRTGRIIPVIKIQPTVIGGVTVNRATGFNAQFIAAEGINKGSVVKLVRSGDVIPYVVKVVKSEPTDLPVYCPSCEHLLKWKGVDLVCESVTCSTSNMLKLEHFIRTLGAENITKKTLSKLGVETVQELYDLDEFDILEIESFGPKRTEQVLNEIQKTLKTTPEKLLAAFGIPGVGLETAKKILEKFDFEYLFKIKRYELQEKVNGIGDSIDKKFYESIRTFETLYNFLKNEGLSFEVIKEKPLEGKSFVMTGKGPIGRNILQNMIHEKGGLVKNSVTKDTDFLITANLDSTSGKMKKASKYGTKIINYDELMEILDGTM